MPTCDWLLDERKKYRNDHAINICLQHTYSNNIYAHTLTDYKWWIIDKRITTGPPLSFYVHVENSLPQILYWVSDKQVLSHLGDIWGFTPLPPDGNGSLAVGAAPWLCVCTLGHLYLAFLIPSPQCKLQKCVLKALELPALGLCVVFHFYCLYYTELHKIQVAVKSTLLCKQCMHLIKSCILALSLFCLTSPSPSVSSGEKAVAWVAVCKSAHGFVFLRSCMTHLCIYK